MNNYECECECKWEGTDAVWFFSRGWMDGVLFGRVEVKCGEVVFISLL